MPSLVSFPVSVVSAAFVVGSLLTLFLLRRCQVRKTLPYPPGPRPLPLVGNLFHVPQSRFALAWTNLGAQYGPMTWLTVPGQNFLVLNSFEAANELLERRGSIYVNRPRWVMLRELLGQVSALLVQCGI
ncbi:hypothetical protein M407DRAFT_65898 [Tulasnella calospora MUT 4182]|uniref:Cytochrome P450 n=1 Tax=Tulasnella calospora MUT 4182 TaxID=1051891 RepID=A0A0C3QWG4_9AGAM|nr:hypothetical protein M407DRAFT_65898 [Tulasnella calospora MUT 4182]